MILSFRAIDNHLQRQLLKLMKYVDAEDTKEALYVGYSIIRSHIINIINKIKDYYKYHDKLTSLYSIDEMYIPGIKPKFIIPSLSDDVSVIVLESTFLTSITAKSPTIVYGDVVAHAD